MKVKKNEFKKEEIKKIREEMKEEWKKHLMKEKHKNVFRKRFSFEKYGRGKERSKKKTKFVNLFLKKEKKKDDPSRKNNTIIVRM